MDPVRRVAIVGGGIAGASAAYALHAQLPGAELVLLESSDRIGGKLRLAEIGGVTVDVGAEAMLARRPEAIALAREVGMGDRLVDPATTSASLWTRDAIRPMPPTVLGIPADPTALAGSGIVSRPGLLRARMARQAHAPRADVSVASFVAAQVGREIVDRLVEPLLGGVYAGHADRLSLRAAAPQIGALAEHDGNLLQAAASTRAAAPADAGPVFAGLRGGVGRLAAAAAEASGADVRTRTTVRELVRLPGGRWRLITGPTNATESVDADAVVLAVPGTPSARLLSEHAPVAARELRAIEYASMAVISLAVPRRSVAADLTGSGFLVPPVDGRRIKAATYSSRKWQWIDDAADDLLIMRTSIGRAGEATVLQRDDAELIGLAVTDLADAIGLRGPLLDAHVQRWGGGLPQYAVGHLERVARIEDAVAGVPGVEVCGAAYHGVGIPAVIATAATAARRTAGHLGASEPG